MIYGKKVINEFAVKNDKEYMLFVKLGDGSVIKAYERRIISDDEIEVIQHLNRNKAGSYYTTRHVYRISEGAVL